MDLSNNSLPRRREAAMPSRYDPANLPYCAQLVSHTAQVLKDQQRTLRDSEERIERLTRNAESASWVGDFSETSPPSSVDSSQAERFAAMHDAKCAVQCPAHLAEHGVRSVHDFIAKCERENVLLSRRNGYEGTPPVAYSWVDGDLLQCDRSLAASKDCSRWTAMHQTCASHLS